MHRVSLGLIVLTLAGAAHDLEWVNPQPIVLDGNGAGAVTMILRNKSVEAVDPVLVIDQFTHSAGAPYTLKSTATATPSGQGKVPANGTMAVAVSVNNVNAAGESTAKVWYKDQNIATLQA